MINQNIFGDKAIITNFQLSPYKSMATLSCHGNQTAEAIAMKNSTSIEASTKILSMKFEVYWPHGSYGDDF